MPRKTYTTRAEKNSAVRNFPFNKLGRILFTACYLVLPIALQAQGFPNVARTPGELLSGPIAPEQGRAAIIAWHGERIISVPEPPGSQPGADLNIRIVNINDPENPQVSVLPARAGGFNSHGYFKYGPYLFVGPHCATSNNEECNGTDNEYRDSFLIGGSGTYIGNSTMVRASMEQDAGLGVGAYNRSGAQSPWGAQMWWSYGAVSGEAWLAVRRSVAEYVYDWTNNGAVTGPAVQSNWDHLAETGVIGMPFIMGNILIYASDQTGTGVATYDISDPSNPVLLDVLKAENPGGYWPEVYGHYIFFPRRNNEGGAGSEAGFMVVDFEDPTDLRVVANRNLEGSNQYVTFQDEFAFMNNYKIDMRTFDTVLTLATNDTTLDASQFALPVGNLVITGGYGSTGPGLAIWAHQAEPDHRSPFVLYHVPKADQSNYSTLCPIVLSIPETLKTETIVSGSSLIVRPIINDVPGAAIPVWHSFGQNKLLTVTPMQPLADDTTYEVVLTSDIEDAMGNGLEPYSFRFSTGSSLVGGNEPPSVDSLSSTPEIALPNTPVTLNWAGSDPDGGALEYRVDFGDGSPRTAWANTLTTQYTYAEEGHYQVTVQVRDALGSLAARSRTVTVITPPTQINSTASSTIVLNEANDWLYVVNPDTDTVSAFTASTMAKRWEVEVGKHPKSLAIASDDTVWVASRDSDSVEILNGNSGATVQTLTLPYGARPVGICAAPNGNAILLTTEGDQLLRRYSATSQSLLDSLPLGPSPRAIAVTHNGNRALVTRFISGKHTAEVYDVNLSGALSLTRTITLLRDYSDDGSASSRGVPNYLAGIRISPTGSHAWVVGKKDNTNRGTFFADHLSLGHDNTVRAQLMLIDLSANSEDVSMRMDIDNSDSPTAVAFSPMGDYAFIALQGNGQVAAIDVLDFLNPSSPGSVSTRWSTGIAPQGILMNPATQQLYTMDFMDRTVTVLDIDTFLNEGSANISSVSVEAIEVERLNPEVALGKKIFYNAGDPRMSAESYISCATCHIDGGHDGRTFDFTNRGEGFRNTTDLRGRSGMGHGFVHWSSNFDEIQDFENDIRGAFGGTGFLTDEQFSNVSDTLGTPKAGLSADLDALAAYVTSLGSASYPKSPYRDSTTGALSEAAQRGALLFATNNCASCHNPVTDYTDRTVHNVGTMRASSGARMGASLSGIDTPTLLGLHDTAPYLHDGSATTLAEVFTTAGGTLLQGEDATASGQAQPQDINWIALKDWHQGMFMNFDGAGAMQFSGITSTVSGAGSVELRYNSSYGSTPITVTVNGNNVSFTLPQTPNNPGWRPNEWRSVRIPVTFQAGANNVSIMRGSSGGGLKVDDVLITTPDDMALASAHVRGFSPTELDDLVAYLVSLDSTDALLPTVTVSREGMVFMGSTDVVEIPVAASSYTAIYTITNNGVGPLNLGNFVLNSTPAEGIWIQSLPEAHLPAGGSTSLAIHLESSAIGSNHTVTGWSDDSSAQTMSWTISPTEALQSRVDDYLMFE